LTYTSGKVSLGSTSPLWTALLSVGYLLHVPPLPWAFALGISSWLLLAWVSAALTMQLFPKERHVAFVVGLACLAEWHLAWAALSGLEIALFAFLSLLLIERHAAGAHPVWVGMIGGLLIWVRPEGIVLTGLLIGAVVIEGLVSGWRMARRPRRCRSVAGLVVGSALLWLPYVGLNLALSGQPLPNTFYAKQAEYQALLARPIWIRLWDVVRPPLVGAQVLLVPGFVWQATVGMRQLVGTVRKPSTRDKSGSCAGCQWLVLAWWVAYHVIYALRLPVGYQHGRYLMPSIPIMLVYGMVGTARWARLENGSRVARPLRARLGRVLRRVLVLAWCCLSVAFLVLGGRAFAEDVCTIQCEMVDVALWLRAHTQTTSLVAAHDIGAVGYWSERPLIDLAGLVTPEVIPYIRDEEQLLAFLVEQGADYVAVFPSWYPAMVRDDRLVRVYGTNCPLTRAQGGDNLAVYQINDRGGAAGSK
jgi:hypothetical protein